MTASLREERKSVPAVFADLVGSTSLAERLDPEEVKLIVGEAVARIVRATEEFGGTVKDLAGDGVLALFGAPVSHEDDAERALRAALKIVQEIREYGGEVARGWDVEGLAVRVGVATGPVVLGQVGAGQRIEYAAFGDTVNIAARLQAHAQPGTVLAGAATHQMAEPLFSWGSPRELAVKGKAQPVLAFEVERALPASGKARGLRGVQARLVGRDAELAAGREAIEEILRGRGGGLFVSGQAGVREGWPLSAQRSWGVERGRPGLPSRSRPVYGRLRCSG